MKKVLRWVGIGIGAIVALVACFLLYVAIDGIPRYTPEAIDLHVQVTPERVARGKHFVTMLCADCHKNPVTRQLTGRAMDDAPPEFGRLYSKNITRHPTKGIGARSDGDLAYLLRTGVRPWDRQYIPPYMAKMPLLADEDLFSIIAFLRSDDDLVRANDADAEPVVPSFLTKFLSHVAFHPLPYPKQPVVAPPATDKAAYGRYLVSALECFSCHSADFKTMDVMSPEKSEGYMGGGNVMLQMNGVPITTTNLTPDDETGIGRWSLADFRHAVRDGFRPDGSLIRYPMLRLPELSDDEVEDLYVYLRGVPKLHNPRKPTAPDPDYADHSPGSVAYHAYGCVTCHGETGIAYADLRPAKLKYPTNDALIAFLRHPSETLPDTKMPTWDGVIKEADYAPLGEYVRKLAQQ